jgi:hypothetical protein
MIRFRNFLPIVAALVGAAILGSPTQARAGFAVEISVNGGAFQAANVTTLDSQDATYTYSITGVVTITGSLSSTFPGSPIGAGLTLGNTTHVQFTGTTAGSIEIVSSQNFFTAPTSTPLSLSSSVGGSLQTTGTGASVSSTFQGVLDNTNTNFGIGNGTLLSPGGSPLASQSTPGQNASASTTGTGTASLVYSPGTSTNLVNSATPFALENILTFSGTPVLNEIVGASGTTTASPTPLPAGLVLALTGFPALGIGAWFRRRRQSV